MQSDLSFDLDVLETVKVELEDIAFDTDKPVEVKIEPEECPCSAKRDKPTCSGSEVEILEVKKEVTVRICDENDLGVINGYNAMPQGAADNLRTTTDSLQMSAQNEDGNDDVIMMIDAKEEVLKSLVDGQEDEAVQDQPRRSKRAPKLKKSYLDLFSAFNSADNGNQKTDDDADYDDTVGKEERHSKPVILSRNPVGRKKKRRLKGKTSPTLSKVDVEKPGDLEKSDDNTGPRNSKKSVDVRSRDAKNTAESSHSWSCKDCKSAFLSQSKLKHHQLTCKEVNSRFERPSMSADCKQSGRKKYFCPICHDRVFLKRNGVKVHLVQSHSNLVHITCVLCQMKVGNVEEAYQHMVSQHRPSSLQDKTNNAVYCPMCSEKFKDKKSLKPHVINSHSDTQRVQCTLCLRTVGSVLDYLQHFETYHVPVDGNSSEVVCAMPTVNPRTKSSNTTAGTKQETEQKGFVCIYCHKNFSTYKLLTLHILSHKVMENMDKVSSDVDLSLKESGQEWLADITNSSKNGSHQSRSIEEFPISTNTRPEARFMPSHSRFSFFGYDLLKAVNSSLLAMTRLSSKLHSKLDWQDEGTRPKNRTDLLHALNGILQFSSGIADVGKCLLLVVEECMQFSGRDAYSHSDNDDNDTDEDYEAGDKTSDALKKEQDSVLSASCSKSLPDDTDAITQPCALPGVSCNDTESSPENCYSISGESVESYKAEANNSMEVEERNHQEKECVKVTDNFRETEKDGIEFSLVSNCSSSSSLNACQNPINGKTNSGNCDLTFKGNNCLPEKDQAESIVCTTEGIMGSGSGSKQVAEITGSLDVYNEQFRRISSRLRSGSRHFPSRTQAVIDPIAQNKRTTKNNKKKCVCKLCGIKTRDPYKLKRHEVTHQVWRPFQCKECLRSFTTEASLEIHSRRIHLKAMGHKFKCDFCDLSYPSLMNLREHMIVHKDADCFSCDQCHFKFKVSTSYELKMHKNEAHTMKKCSFCDYEAENKRSLKLHEREKHINFRCMQCNFVCSFKLEIMRHQLGHKKAESFCCDLCGATFNTAARLKYHKERHFNRTPFSCPHCEYKCSSKTSYNGHLLKHTGLKPYVCKICGAAYQRSHYLRQHALIHTGEKPHVCSICGKGFRSTYNLREHEAIHTGEKKFKCHLCLARFKRRKFLNNHIKAKHESGTADTE